MSILMNGRLKAANQHGAVVIMTAGFMLLGILFLALAVDTGRLYIEKRKLQRVADMAAIDTVNRGALCGATSLAALQNLAQASASLNGYEGTVQVETGYVDRDLINGVRLFRTDMTRTEAVKVIVTNTVPASIVAGGIFGNEITLRGEAVAQRMVQAGIMGGTNLLSLDSSTSPLLDPLLKGLFGSGFVGVDVLSASGIAKAGLTLKDLLGVDGLDVLEADSLTVGGMQDLLNTGGLKVLDLLDASVSALSAKQGGSDSGVLALQAMNGTIAANVKNADLVLGDILDIKAAESLAAQVNVLDLITAAAYVAHKDDPSALNLPLGINLPNLAQIGVSLKVIEPPKVAYGKPGFASPGVYNTEVRSAQIALTVSAEANLIGLGIIDIGIGVGVADGLAWLKSANCQNLGDNYAITVNANTATATLAIGAPDWLANNPSFWKDNPSAVSAHPASIRVSLLGLVDILKINVYAVLPRGASSSQDGVFTVLDKSSLPSDVLRISSGGAGLSSSVNGLTLQASTEILGGCGLLCGLLNGLINPTVNTLVSLLKPLLVALVDSVVSPLLALLGANINSMDVTLLSIDDDGAELVR